MIVGVFWYPDECTLVELRGGSATVIARTSAEDAYTADATWLDTCGYTDHRKQRLEREFVRLHARLKEFRQRNG